MPEGDSYTRAADRLRPVLVGRVVEAVDGVPSIRKWAGKLVGAKVTGIRTHGKHLLIDLDGVSIHVWLGMPGRFRVRDHGGRTTAVVDERRRSRRGPDDRGAVRLLLRTADHEVLCYSAPTVDVERTRVIDRVLDRLGPDVLADEFDWPSYRARTARVDGDRWVADLLLDQRVLAGVGNEYKNEVLFLEGMHPRTQVGSLDAPTLDALARRARRLMLPNAHRAGRITTGTRGPSMESWVFERTGRPCRRCRTEIVSDHIGRRHPRITYWCPTCQPEPADH